MTYVENESPEGWIEVPIEIPEAGLYSISVYQIRWDDLGVYRVTLRGPEGDVLLDPAMDFYDYDRSDRSRWPESSLYGSWHEKKIGVHRLKAGSYAMRFECLGANPVSRVPGTRFSYIGTPILDPERAFRPGYGMALDGISLRRLPWDEDAWSWMQRYLVREEALFAERVDQAREDVARLDEAVRGFARDNGACPRDLSELVVPPARLAERVGQWPYLSGGLPVDPWGQQYRYRCPGEQRPDGFDLWSVHGNERRPEGWIGNWESPAQR